MWNIFHPTKKRLIFYYSTPEVRPEYRGLVFPWLACGRIPAKSSAEAWDIVGRIINYEKHPPSDLSYYKKMSFVAVFQGSGGQDAEPDDPLEGKASRNYVKTMETIRQRMQSLGFEVERIYEAETGSPMKRYCDGSKIPQEVIGQTISKKHPGALKRKLISAMEQGRMIIAHRGHGAPSGWMKPELTSGDVRSITSEFPTLFFSLNCFKREFRRQRRV